MKNLQTTRYWFTLGKFDFYCDSRKNRSGFVHEWKLYYWNYSCPVETGKIQYYNRTWESFCYQTLLKKLFFNFLETQDRAFLEENKDDIQKIYEDLSNGGTYYFKVLRKL